MRMLYSQTHYSSLAPPEDGDGRRTLGPQLDGPFVSEIVPNIRMLMYFMVTEKVTANFQCTFVQRTLVRKSLSRRLEQSTYLSSRPKLNPVHCPHCLTRYLMNLVDLDTIMVSALEGPSVEAWCYATTIGAILFLDEKVECPAVIQSSASATLVFHSLIIVSLSCSRISL